MRYLLLLAFLLLPATTQAVWFDSDWDYRVPVEIVPSKVGTTSAITSFPVYVSLADMPVEFWSNVQADGDDIRVVESDETTETAFDLVAISTASSTGELHFLADSLSTTSTSTFYIYYGNSGASGYASTTSFGSQAVWTGYTDVVHLNEDPTGTSPQYFDSTGGSKLAASSYESDDLVVGKLGLAVDPDDSADNQITNSDTNFINSSFSISWWIKPKGITNYNNSVGSSAWGNFLCHTAVGGAVYCGTQLGSRLVTSGNYWTTGNWHHMTYTYASGTQSLYKNGVLTHSGSTASSTSNWAGLWIGAGSTNTRIDGTVDEVRTRVAPLSAAWIWTEYNNQSTTTEFYSIGVQELSTVVFSTAGTYSWTAPDAATHAFVQCWGAGGGGGAIANTGGGGGGGGAYAAATTSVTPGFPYPVVIGAGGPGDNSARAASSSFGTTTVFAEGGGGTSGASIGTGGSTANSSGTIEYAGGSGSLGNTTGDIGGGGGGAAGPDGAGLTPANATSGVGANGGAGNNGLGGAGGIGDSNGSADPGGGAGGSDPTGGGGGGGGDDQDPGGVGGAPGGGGGGGEIGTSAAGAAGQCIVTALTLEEEGGGGPATSTPGIMDIFWFN